MPTALPGSVAAATSGVPIGAKRRGFEGPSLDGETKPRPFPLLPARVGGADETIVFVECLSDGVVVHPSGKSFSIDSLNHSPSHNAMYNAVAGRLAKHSGDPKQRAIRFLIHRDGERTYHLAYPVFNRLNVEQKRIDLHPGDDVSRIVAGE